ncbi:MAG: hypothetical protein SW833_10935 [Cyanobacteriota bacterium]|nr:hypothetical protein [Cyanobacteriota bacterium]
MLTLKGISIYIIGSLVTLGTLSTTSESAFARLEGDSISGTISIGNGPTTPYTPPTAIVDNINPEFEMDGEFFVEDDTGNLSIDFMESMLTLTLTRTSDEPLSNSWMTTFLDLDWIDRPGKIVGLDLVNSGLTGITGTFTDDSIKITYGGGDIFGEGESRMAKFNIQTKHTPEPTSVLSLFALGTLSAALIKYKGKSS